FSNSPLSTACIFADRAKEVSIQPGTKPRSRLTPSRSRPFPLRENTALCETAAATLGLVPFPLFATMSRRQCRYPPRISSDPSPGRPTSYQTRARSDSAAEITAYRNIGAEAQPHSFLKGAAKFFGIFGIRPLWADIVRPWIIEIPILAQLNVLIGRDHVMSGGDLINPLEQCPHLVPANSAGVINGFGIPTSRHSRSEQSLHLRS